MPASLPFRKQEFPILRYCRKRISRRKKKAITLTAEEYGTYIGLLKGARDDYALTVRIINPVNEEEQIKEYKKNYGSENVTVIDFKQIIANGKMLTSSGIRQDTNSVTVTVEE